MKQNVRLEVSNKLVSIATLIKECAVRVYGLDPTLMQETTLAALTHESLCDMLEKEGYSDKLILLINGFGKAVAQLYTNIDTFKTSPSEALINNLIHSTTKNNKTLLN